MVDGDTQAGMPSTATTEYALTEEKHFTNAMHHRKLLKRADGEPAMISFNPVKDMLQGRVAAERKPKHRTRTVTQGEQSEQPQTKCDRSNSIWNTNLSRSANVAVRYSLAVFGSTFSILFLHDFWSGVMA